MIAFVAVGCAVVAVQKLNELWGKEEVRDRSDGLVIFGPFLQTAVLNLTK
jgi:hypothetical protein